MKLAPLKNPQSHSSTLPIVPKSLFTFPHIFFQLLAFPARAPPTTYLTAMGYQPFKTIYSRCLKMYRARCHHTRFTDYGNADRHQG